MKTLGSRSGSVQHTCHRSGSPAVASLSPDITSCPLHYCLSEHFDLSPPIRLHFFLSGFYVTPDPSGSSEADLAV